MRVLVSGSRTWEDVDIIWKDLESLLDRARDLGETMTLVHGDCPLGADAIAERWFMEMMAVDTLGLECERHPADWDRHGKKAGFIRNRAMVESGIDIVLVYIHDNSRGATHTLGLARAAGLRRKVRRRTGVDWWEPMETEERPIPGLGVGDVQEERAGGVRPEAERDPQARVVDPGAVGGTGGRQPGHDQSGGAGGVPDVERHGGAPVGGGIGVLHGVPASGHGAGAVGEGGVPMARQADVEGVGVLYEVWAEAWPDAPGASAWITLVEPVILDEKGYSPVSAMTCTPEGHAHEMGDMVEGLFRVFVDLPDEARVRVHLRWLEGPPKALLELIGE